MSPFFTLPVTTPERQVEIDAQWADVRAGLHHPEPHVFGADAQSAIAGHRFRSMVLIREAARHAEIAVNLSTVEANT